MKKRLLLLVLASAVAITGCVTTAGYRGHGGGYHGSSSDYYRQSRSTPYGYYEDDRYYYGYDRYRYDRYGRPYGNSYGYPYGYSYGYPHGYAPYYNNNRYYYYYPTPQRPPTTGNNPPPLDPRLNPTSVQYGGGNTQPMEQMRDPESLRERSRYREVRQPMPDLDDQDRPESLQSVMESPRRMRPSRQMMMPMPSRAPVSSSPAAPTSDPSSLLENVR